MKTEPSWASGDFVTIDLWTEKEVFDAGFLIGFFNTIAEICPHFMPQRVYGGRTLTRRRFVDGGTDSRVLGLVKSLGKIVKTLGAEELSLEGGSESSENLMIIAGTSAVSRFYSVHISAVASSIGSVVKIESLNALFIALARYLNAVYGFMSSTEERRYKMEYPRYDSKGAFIGHVHPALRPEKGLHGLFHLNYFGTDFVSFFGASIQRVARFIPVIQVEPGGMLIRIGESPFDWRIEQNLRSSFEGARVLNHGSFFDPERPEEELKTPFAKPERPKANLPVERQCFHRVSRNQGKEFARVSTTFIEGIRDTFGKDLKKDGQSLSQLDSIIAQGWKGKRPEMFEEVVSSFATFLGEALIEVHGGEWVWCDEGDPFAVVLSDGTIVFPYSKIRRRFENGMEDSIGFFLQILEQEIGQRLSGRR